MIKQIKDITPYSDFLRGFYNDYRFFAQPETEEEIFDKLQKQAADPDNITLAASCCGRIAGIFAFLYIKEEKYMEMLTGISEDGAAYDELIAYL